MVARGESQFESGDIPAIAGMKSAAMAARYAQRKHLEVVHRNDLVLV